jgi:diguanylate cyclase (GGDEF)-like protein/PAS domain S-box-containing protein
MIRLTPLTEFPMLEELTAFTQHFSFHVQRRGSVYSYLLAVALMGFAFWLRLEIAPVSAGLQYLTFFPAVTLAAIVGGYSAGFLATIIGVVLATYIFTPPYYSFSIEGWQLSLWSNLVFLLNGIIVSLSIEAMHRYREKYVLELKQSTEALAALEGSTQHVRKILDNLFAYVALLDTNGVVQEMNKAPLERSGYPRENVIGQYFYDGPWWSYDETVRAQLMEAIDGAKQGQARRYDVVVKMGDDLVPIDFMISPVYDERGNIIGLLPTAVDITARKQAEEEVRRLASHDTLTKLPNRRLLNDRLDQTIAASKRSGRYAALLFLDLDNFKPLNDKHGHAVGDLLLIEAAQRLKNCVRETDTVARVGGDEFVVLLSELDLDKTESTTQALNVAEKILTSLSESYRLAIRNEEKADVIVDHLCTTSIGAAVFNSQDESTDDIIRWADLAMYQAKKAGRNSIRFHDSAP